MKTLGLLSLLSLVLQNAHAFVSQSTGITQMPVVRHTRHPPTPAFAPRILLSRLLLAASDDDGASSSSSKAKVRFSGVSGGVDSQSATVSNPADYVLSWIASDVGSIVLGLAGIILLLIGRLALDTDDVVVQQDMGQVTRSNLLAVFAAGAVLLNGLSKLDVESTMAQAVVLVGTALPEPVFLQDDTVGHPVQEWKWALDSLLVATPTETAVVLEQTGNDEWKFVTMAGIVPSDKPSQLPPTTTPILDRSVKQDRFAETYLPTLQALPGRTEFTYLPTNTQATLVLPVLMDEQKKIVLVLGSNQAKSYTPRDIAWCQVVVSRLAEAYGKY